MISIEGIRKTIVKVVEPKTVIYPHESPEQAIIREWIDSEAKVKTGSGLTPFEMEIDRIIEASLEGFRQTNPTALPFTHRGSHDVSLKARLTRLRSNS